YCLSPHLYIVLYPTIHTHKKPPISYVQEMGGSSIAGGFVFRALLALNRLKPRNEKAASLFGLLLIVII
ncbi:MAG: hypothetical protein KH394_05295, partial [Atopobium sp.]|nr:hypothetical protein [Atopobium sp.]